MPLMDLVNAWVVIFVLGDCSDVNYSKLPRVQAPLLWFPGHPHFVFNLSFENFFPSVFSRQGNPRENSYCFG